MPRITIEYDELSGYQKETLGRIQKLCKTAHFVDLKFRDSGKDKIEPADFLKTILIQIE